MFFSGFIVAGAALAVEILYAAAVLGACAAVDAADPADRAAAAASGEGAADRVAVSSPGAGRAPRRRRGPVSQPPARRPRAGVAVPVLFALAALAIFIALGTWQIERKAWKEALIDTLERRLSAPAVELPPRGALGGARSRRERVPPRAIGRGIAARRRGARLRQRIGSAHRRLGARLLDIRAGADRDRRARRRQSRFRAAGAAGSREPAGAQVDGLRDHGRSAALAAAARLLRARRRAGPQSLVRARSGGDRRRQGLGRGGAVLRRAGEPAARGRAAARRTQ